MAFVGWSLGATAVLAIGLTDDIDPAGGPPVPGNPPRPDVIVAISGCYFEYRGVRQNFLDVSGCGNKDADLTLVAGDKDTTCAAWQSDDAAAQLRSAGYDVQLLTLQGPAIIRPLTRQAAAGHCGDEDNARARAVAVLVRSSESSTEHRAPATESHVIAGAITDPARTGRQSSATCCAERVRSRTPGASSTKPYR
ncbi:MAG: hypothetical protein ACRDWG_11775 [Actinomycetes bacterium]